MDGRTSRWERHNDAQRRRIVAAAIALYDEGRIGASLHEIGLRAGVSRSVLYRQFADRNDLERAVQRHLMAELWARLGPSFRAEPGLETFRSAVEVYVAWAAAHPRLHQIAGLDSGADGPLRQAIGYLSTALARNLGAWFRREGADLDAAEIATIDVLAHGVIGTVFSMVRRWVDAGASLPEAEVVIELAAGSAWSLVETYAGGLPAVRGPARAP